MLLRVWQTLPPSTRYETIFTRAQSLTKSRHNLAHATKNGKNKETAVVAKLVHTELIATN